MVKKIIVGVCIICLIIAVHIILCTDSINLNTQTLTGSAGLVAQETEEAQNDYQSCLMAIYERVEIDGAIILKKTDEIMLFDKCPEQAEVRESGIVTTIP